MLIAIFFIIVTIAGGFALTYLFDRESSFLGRVAAGSVIGQCIFGTAVFGLSFAMGLSPLSVAIAVAISLLPVLLLREPTRLKFVKHDWAKAKGRLAGANTQRFFGFIYYLFFFVLFIAFFDRAYFANEQGIFTGGSQNLGDLPFHLGIIYSFTDAANFPPQNPSFAGAKLSYPFIPDLITAAVMKTGVGVRESMLVLNVAWAFSLLVVLENFVRRLTEDKFASRVAAGLLFFTGGLGFLWFFSDIGAQTKGISDFLMALPKDYTIGEEFRWGNSLVTLFMTQRSLLLGMPLALIVLTYLWRVFSSDAEETSEGYSALLPSFVVGLIGGMLPLIHLHSLFVLFIVTAFLLAMRLQRWKDWVAFGLGVCIIAIPELAWSITGSASNAAAFLELHFGWDAGKNNVAWFWIKNTGLLLPLIAAGIYLLLPKYDKGEKQEAGNTTLLKFYVPFAFIFVIANMAKFAPWEWDNIKLLIYWLVGSLPLIALFVSWLWQKTAAAKAVAVACVVILAFSGALDVWRTVTRQINYKVFDAPAAVMADRAKAVVPPKALILNAPTYNSAAVLTGRISLMRYGGHLHSHGIEHDARELDLEAIYRGGPAAQALIDKYGIGYVLMSPEERKPPVTPNESFFAQFPVAAEAGAYKLYKVR